MTSLFIFRGAAFLWSSVGAIEEVEETSDFNVELCRFRIYRVWSIILGEKSAELKAKLDKCVSTFANH